MAPMNETEEKIITAIRDFNSNQRRTYLLGRLTKEFKEVIDLFTQQLRLPFGESSLEFRDHELLARHLAIKQKGYKSSGMRFWLLIENLITTQDIATQETMLQEIGLSLVKLYRKRWNNMDGTFVYPQYVNGTFMLNVYATNNAQLIRLFTRFLPIPEHEDIIFAQHLVVPKYIAERIGSKSHIIKKALAKILPEFGSLEVLESLIIKKQREKRAFIRREKEKLRIKSIKDFLDFGYFSEDDIIAEANKLYTPRCRSDLAERIGGIISDMEALFKTLKHVTDNKFLGGILDTCLFGRKTLQDLGVDYRASTLANIDVRNGDSNSICFAPFDIDKTAYKPNTVEIIFDFDKMQLNHNPAMYFKLRDFGCTDGSSYKIETRDPVLTDLSFFYEEPHGREHDQHVSFLNVRFTVAPPPVSARRKQVVLIGGTQTPNSVRVPNFLLLSYNLSQIHQILVRNFFRFIDGLQYKYRNSIYDALDRMSDPELKTFLITVAKNIAATAEVNFYGAYKIDLSTILSVRNIDTGYVLNMQGLISLLNSRSPLLDKELSAIQGQFPTLLNSYRFIDYLLLQTTNTEAQSKLQEFRSKCFVPSWRQHLRTHSADTLCLKKEPPSSSSSSSASSLLCNP